MEENAMDYIQAAANVFADRVQKAAKQWKKELHGRPDDAYLKKLASEVEQSIKIAVRLIQVKGFETVKIHTDSFNSYGRLVWSISDGSGNRETLSFKTGVQIPAQSMPENFSIKIVPSAKRVSFKHGKVGHKYISPKKMEWIKNYLA
jgi:hypothetical protein